MKSKMYYSMFVLIIVLLAAVSTSAREVQERTHGTQSVDVWTEQDWVIWWNYIESRRQSGASEEEIYWLIKYQMDALAAIDPRFGFDYPPPYSGWDSGGPGEVIPYRHFGSPQLQDGDDSGYSLQNFVCGSDSNYPFSSCPYQPDLLEPPPLWLAATMAWTGGILSRSSHPVAKVIGYAIIDVAGGMIIFIEILEEEEEEGDNDGE